MTQDRPDLRDALERLRRQLRELPALDPAVATNLENTIADVERSLAETSAEARQPGGLVDRLSEAARQFEDSHPGLSGTIGGVIDALGRMGI